MLPKKLRITKERDILVAFRTKYRYFGNVVKIYMSHNTEQQFKLLVVVSKKISKRAHDRNRIKHKIHAIFELLYRDGRLPPSVSCVIQVSDKRIITMTSSEIRELLIPQISKLYGKMKP